MKRGLKVIWHLCAILGVAAIAGTAWLLAQGIGTRSEPSAVEVSVARAARHYAIPASARARANPIAVSQDTLREGLEHWADHCAGCHGNDGRGDTEVGRALYPRVPDMRAEATQQLSDGELFYIIENGVKLTGMPAWGTGEAEGEHASWHLVHFIRRLPQLTEEELEQMSELNPRGAAEWRQLEEQRRFLSGETDASAAPEKKPPHKHNGGH